MSYGRHLMAIWGTLMITDTGKIDNICLFFVYLNLENLTFLNFNISEMYRAIPRCRKSIFISFMVTRNILPTYINYHCPNWVKNCDQKFEREIVPDVLATYPLSLIKK